MRGILEDLRYAAAVLRRTPAWTAVAVLTLALGIAATTTVFGWIDGMVLHPFRGATDDGQLAVLESVRASGLQAPSVSYADCQDFQDSLRSISGLLLNQKGPASIGDGENAYSAWFELVSGNYFDVLGVKPSLGRTFTRDEYGDRARAFTAVISYRLWQEYFRGDPSILGRAVRINRHQVTIVGVAPPEFHGDFPGVALDGWIPAPLTGEGERGARNFQGHRQAQTRRQRLRGKCRSGDGCRAACPRLSEDQRGDRRPDRTDLEGAGGGVKHFGIAHGHPRCACGLVLLIACANVSQSSAGSFRVPAEGVRHPRCPGRESGPLEPPVGFRKPASGGSGDACGVASRSVVSGPPPVISCRLLEYRCTSTPTRASGCFFLPPWSAWLPP